MWEPVTRMMKKNDSDKCFYWTSGGSNQYTVLLEVINVIKLFQKNKKNNKKNFVKWGVKEKKIKGKRVKILYRFMLNLVSWPCSCKIWAQFQSDILILWKIALSLLMHLSTSTVRFYWICVCCCSAFVLTNILPQI